MSADRETLLDEVMWRGGIGDRSRAEVAVEASLEALAAELTPADARRLAAWLPPSFAGALERRKPAAPAGPDTLYTQLATREKVSHGIAIEHARAACAAIAQSLDAEDRGFLARRLPAVWAALLAPFESAPESGTPGGTPPGHGRTLATGKPGSRHPLAEARAPGAQAESVVAAENPHGTSKLSSGGGS
jgi:uncharacterized protein (DUF2267 family)